VNKYQAALSETAKKFAALGDPPVFRGWMSAGGHRRLSGMNMFQRYNLDLRLYQTGAWTTLPVGILPAWQLSVLYAQGFWYSTSKVIRFGIETLGFREDLESYIGYSWKFPASGMFEYQSFPSPAIIFISAYYDFNPESVSIWLRPMSVGYPPGAKIKLEVPIRTIPG